MADQSIVSHERLRQLRESGYIAGNSGNSGRALGQGVSQSQQAPEAGAERVVEEVPPPAYEEVMEQTQQKKA